MSQGNYGALLTGWAAQATQSGVTLGADGLSYPASASSARDVLVQQRNWTITDAGVGP
jgi:hypothetical protein